MHQSDSLFYLSFDQWQHLHAFSEVRTNYAAIRRIIWAKNLEVTSSARVRPINVSVSFVCYLGPVYKQGNPSKRVKR